MYWLRWSVTKWVSYKDFKAKYPDAIVIFVLYEGTLRAVRHYEAKRGLEFKENCNINEAYVWECMSGGGEFEWCH